MQEQDGLLPCELHELAFPQTSRERSAIDRIDILKVDIVMVIGAKYSRQKPCSKSLSQSETSLPFSPEHSNIIAPKSYKKRCECTSGSALRYHSLCTLRDRPSWWHSNCVHCSSQARRLPLGFSSRFKQQTGISVHLFA